MQRGMETGEMKEERKREGCGRDEGGFRRQWRTKLSDAEGR